MSNSSRQVQKQENRNVVSIEGSEMITEYAEKYSPRARPGPVSRLMETDVLTDARQVFEKQLFFWRFLQKWWIHNNNNNRELIERFQKLKALYN